MAGISYIRKDDFMPLPETYNTQLTEDELSAAFENAAKVPDLESAVREHASRIMMNTANLDLISQILTLHTDNTELHVSAEERASWEETKERAALNRSTLGYQRKNLLKNIGTTDTKNGVTFTKNSDGSIAVTGTASGTNATFRIANDFYLEPGRYILSGCPQGGSGAGYRIQMSHLDYSFFGRDEGHGFVFEVTESAHFIISIIIQNGMSVSDLTFYPMIRFAEITDDTYEPYKSSVEDQIEAICESTPYKLAAWDEDISENDDLNSYVTPGTYKSGSSVITASLSNKPEGITTGFKLRVEYVFHTVHIFQEIISQTGSIYVRRINLSAGVCGAWERLISASELASLEARVAALEGGEK